MAAHFIQHRPLVTLRLCLRTSSRVTLSEAAYLRDPTALWCNEMQRPTLSVLVMPLCFAITGCGPRLSKPPKELLVGTWVLHVEIDDAQLDDMLSNQGIRAEDIPKVKELTKSKMESELQLTITLLADGASEATTVVPGKKKKTTKGTWEVTNESSHGVTFKSTDSSGVETVTVNFRNDDEFEFSSDDPQIKDVPFKTPLVFKRRK